MTLPQINFSKTQVTENPRKADCRHPSSIFDSRFSGFTLIELITVLAIAAVLMAVVVPLASGARRQYAIMETKARFQRYTLAFEQFKAETGGYPDFGASPSDINDTPDRFVQILTGRAHDGGSMTDAEALRQNPNKLSFLQLSSAEITPDGKIQDSFGNTAIKLYRDLDGDGFLDGLTNVRGNIGWQSAGSELTIQSWK